MDELKILHGLQQNLPTNRDKNTFYHTTDKKDLYVGETRYTREDEHENHEERITTLEKDKTSPFSNDLKDAMVQYYKYLGSTDSKQKAYTDKIISSIKNMEEFAKLGTGLFIHWGVYSVPAGHYEGVDSRGNTVNKNISYNCEWSMRDLGIPKDIYKAYEAQFTGELFDAEALVKKVADCGMKYIILTVKHHEGFTLCPTTYGLWDVRTSACRNTIVDELKASCDKYGIKLAFYYSQYWDWMGEGGFGLDHGKKWCDTDPYTEEQHLAYCNSAVNEINELIEKYDPYILWYDPGTSYASKYVNIFVSGETANYPHIITNDRLDYGRTYGDYGTGERTIYLRNKLKYGESCFTLNDTWGYSVNNDNKYFSTEKVFKQFLLYTLSYGQNCVLNVGPKPDGSVPQKQLDMLTNIENFTKAYGSFANYQRINYVSRPKFGYMIELEGNKILCYVIAKNNQNYSDIVIDNVSVKNLESVDILTHSGNATYTIENGKIYIHGLSLDETTKVGVVRLNYSSKPIHIDANLLDAEELLPSRTFIMKNGLTFDFTNLIYTTKGSNNASHTTEFIWNGDTNDYNGILSFSTTGTSDTITLVIKDTVTSASTTITYLNDATESEDTVHLEKGKRYEATLTFNSNETSTIYIYGFSFAPIVEVIHPTSVNITDEEIEINVDGDVQLTAEVLPEDATDKTVTWKSSDNTIATVSDSGLVRGVNAGDAVITVTTNDGGLIDTCAIVVNSETPVIHPTSITLSHTSLVMNKGEEATIIASVMPSDTTHRGVLWSVGNESIASVENGLVTALSEGNTTITASTIDGCLSATCDVEVAVVHVTSVTLNTNEITLTPGYSEQLLVEVLPTLAEEKSVIWSVEDEAIASVSNDGLVFGKSSGSTIVTVTSVDGSLSATCLVNVSNETYDYSFEAESLDGNSEQGEEVDIKLFSDDMQNWTLFSYVDSSINPNTDNNATLLQCVVNASPWTGFRVDADNNNYPTATTAKSPLLPRFLCGTDRYYNPINGELTSGKPKIDVNAIKHPVCFSRNGDVFKYSIDGVNWVEHEGLNTTQLARLKDCILTIGFDYKRSGGAITNTKYRFLKTDQPCCVVLKNVSNYPFYTLYHEYDKNLSN